MTQYKCFVHLGKHGDLTILASGWYRMFKEFGLRPVVMVSKEFSPTLEGMSYVRRWTVPLHWYGDVGDACKMAEKEFGKDGYCCPKWWDNPNFTPPAIRKNAASLIIHGRRMQIEKDEWFSYMASQWKFAGFPMENLKDRPVFDRRRPEAEESLRQYLFKTRKPKLLFCLNTGGSSPFGAAPEVERMLYSFTDYEPINLMNVRADRIYDLLGVFDQSALLVTTDTATLHLAGACDIPYVAYIADGGGGSIPRGNCILQVRYANALKNIDALKYVITHHQSNHVPVQRGVPAAVLSPSLPLGG